MVGVVLGAVNSKDSNGYRLLATDGKRALVLSYNIPVSRVGGNLG